MVEEFSIENIPVVESKSLIDVDKYKGFKTQIEEVEVVDAIDYYPDGEHYDASSTKMKKVVEIRTAKLPVLDSSGNPTQEFLSYEKDGEKKFVRATARFNLQQEKDASTGETRWVISKAPSAKLWAAMRDSGIKTLPEFKGMIVSLTTQASKNENDDRRYLKIVF